MKMIDLKEQYKLFLDRMGYKDESLMHPEQRKQIKQAFYATWGQCMLTVRDEIGSDVSEEDAVKIFQNMIDQVGEFFHQIMNKQN